MKCTCTAIMILLCNVECDHVQTQQGTVDQLQWYFMLITVYMKSSGVALFTEQFERKYHNKRVLQQQK